MTPNSGLEIGIRRYLLGQLSGDALEDFEKTLLTSDEIYDELLAGEQELVDEYLAGELNPEDRTRFEEFFLVSPERQRQLNFSRALNRYVSTAKPKRLLLVSGWEKLWQEHRWALTAAVSIVILAAVAGLYLRMGMGPTPPQSFATLTLNISEGTRGGNGETAKITLPLGRDALKLVLKMPEAVGPATPARVDLVDPGGETRTLETIEKNAQSISVIIPASDLKRGRFALQLYVTRPGGQDERLPGSYYFSVD